MTGGQGAELPPHVGVAVRADEHQKLERLCGYIASTRESSECPSSVLRVGTLPVWECVESAHSSASASAREFEGSRALEHAGGRTDPHSLIEPLITHRLRPFDLTVGGCARLDARAPTACGSGQVGWRLMRGNCPSSQPPAGSHAASQFIIDDAPQPVPRCTLRAAVADALFDGPHWLPLKCSHPLLKLR